eukprot:GILJ01010681.1.p1 GENE.GILJ01010681.1~~GILJ01010681.1.p1  ORF type:complete len:129 (+),score=7.62 GILJ01010681.1:515-901(+)
MIEVNSLILLLAGFLFVERLDHIIIGQSFAKQTYQFFCCLSEQAMLQQPFITLCLPFSRNVRFLGYVIQAKQIKDQLKMKALFIYRGYRWSFQGYLCHIPFSSPPTLLLALDHSPGLARMRTNQNQKL